MLDTLFLEESKLKDALDRAKDNPNSKPGDIVSLENKLECIQKAIKKCKEAVDITIG